MIFVLSCILTAIIFVGTISFLGFIIWLCLKGIDRLCYTERSQFVGLVLTIILFISLIFMLATGIDKLNNIKKKQNTEQIKIEEVIQI